jgi:hypothetical protein
MRTKLPIGPSGIEPLIRSYQERGIPFTYGPVLFDSIVGNNRQFDPLT